MGASKNYSYLIYTDINRAMNQYNKNRSNIGPNSRLNITDANILSIIKSFSESGTNFFMSNKELAEITISDASTVQKSINKLIGLGLLQKENYYEGNRPKRVLLYQSDAVKNFLAIY